MVKLMVYSLMIKKINQIIYLNKYIASRIRDVMWEIAHTLLSLKL